MTNYIFITKTAQEFEIRNKVNLLPLASGDARPELCISILLTAIIKTVLDLRECFGKEYSRLIRLTAEKVRYICENIYINMFSKT